MIRLTDEMLMAYADGALPEGEAAEIAAALESDAEARATVESFRRTATLSRAAYSDVMAEPVPDNLVRAVLGSQARAANVTDFARFRRPRPSLWPMALPLAASLVLVVGLAAALWNQQIFSGSQKQAIALGPVPAATSLADVLEKRPTGVPVALTGNKLQDAEHLMVLATFRDRKARICREIEALDKNMQPQLAGVACRDPANGTWIVEGTARIAVSPPSGSGDFVPSGAEEKDALDGLLGVLGATKALSTEEEQRLITQGWR